jgi:VanZ family protein
MPGLADARPSALGSALFFYLVAVTILITLAPFRLRPLDRRPVDFAEATAIDLAGNLALFAPLGFLRRATQQAGSSRAWTLGSLALLSAAIEGVQHFSAGRDASVLDVATNTAGAALGLIAFERLRPAWERRLAGRLALELPLMNVVYLLGPLVFVDGLVSGDRPRLVLGSGLLGAFGGGVFAAVAAHRLVPAGLTSPSRAGAAAAAGYLLAAIPALLEAPGAVAALGAGLGLFVWALVRAAGPAGERRFEIPTLRRFGPLFAAYLAAAALWPWTLQARPGWRAEPGLTELPDVPGVAPLLRLASQFAAFSLVGYLAAEYRSRREDPRGRAAAAGALAAALLAAVLEAARGFHPAHAASFARLALGLAAGASGGALYAMQRDAVRRWRVPSPAEVTR